MIGSELAWEHGTALTSRVHSFETELLTRDENLAGVTAINKALIAGVEAIGLPAAAGACIDSTGIPVCGQQEQSAYNGHFRVYLLSPLLLFNRDGDCLAAKLSLGNVHSVEDWNDMLSPEVERQQKQSKDMVVRVRRRLRQIRDVRLQQAGRRSNGSWHTGMR